ncbi:toprim domain-containing protein [Vibrio tritonius]|uniref:Toprim domain-containing protein n=1 Tax=Vibrio tritonius TaxID=1435069 RepID=A0ABS7YG58_9VIBR|nr:toprim domain-containing protein [Vibrio tritonius]MCA2014635.1 toprim domain-containing protein [Vibrio tritonius]
MRDFEKERQQLDEAIINFGWINVLRRFTRLDRSLTGFRPNEKAKTSAMDKHCPDPNCSAVHHKTKRNAKKAQTSASARSGYFALFPTAHIDGSGYCFKCQTRFDGWEMIKRENRWDFPTAVKEVKQYIGFEFDPKFVPSKPINLAPRPTGPTAKDLAFAAKQRNKMNRLWTEAFDFDAVEATPALKYLVKRGIHGIPSVLRGQVKLHPAIPYYIDVPLIDDRSDADDIEYQAWVVNYCQSHPSFVKFFTDKKTGEITGADMGLHPCMLLMVRDNQGKPKRLHRIYIDKDGNKASFHKVGFDIKKMMPGAYGLEITGCACHLDPVGSVVEGVAEGFETTLAVKVGTQMPMHCMINAGGLENYEPMPGTKFVFIWEDKDVSLTGETVGKALQTKLVSKGVQVIRMKVPLPIPEGEKCVDWLDAFAKQGKACFPPIALRWRELLSIA